MSNLSDESRNDLLNSSLVRYRCINLLCMYFAEGRLICYEQNCVLEEEWVVILASPHKLYIQKCIRSIHVSYLQIHPSIHL
jgi:hypothetical protein